MCTCWMLVPIYESMNQSRRYRVYSISIYIALVLLKIKWCITSMHSHIGYMPLQQSTMCLIYDRRLSCHTMKRWLYCKIFHLPFPFILLLNIQPGEVYSIQTILVTRKWVWIFLLFSIDYVTIITIITIFAAMQSILFL